MRTLTATARRRLWHQAVTDLRVISDHLDTSLELIHDSLNGHPQAARYSPPTSPPRLWCFTHQRNHQHCEREALDCGGTPVTNTDPTGDAATTPDPAAAAQATIDRALAALAVAAGTIAAELIAWAPPTTAMQRPDPSSATAPDGWCTSCWRDNRTHEPISVRPGGTAPYYAGLCKWCGDFKNAQGYLPTLPLLRIHHAGRNVGPTDITRYPPHSGTQ